MSAPTAEEDHLHAPVPGQLPLVELRPASRRVLTALTTLRARLGYAPSLQEIADAAGLSARSTVDYHLRLLEQAGHIRRPGRHQPRGVVVLDPEVSP